MTRGTGEDFMEEVCQGFLWKKEDGIGEQHGQSRELSKVLDGRNKLLGK